MGTDSFQNRATMIREMLNHLEGLSAVDATVENQINGLLLGVEKKSYTPLMKRPKCGGFLVEKKIL